MSDFTKKFKYNIGAEPGSKAQPKTYTFAPNDGERKAQMVFDFSDIDGNEEKETVYRFIATLTEEKIDELVAREYARGNIKASDSNDVTYKWEYLPYHYNETWEEYCELVDAGLIGPEFIYFIYRGYHDESGVNYDQITYNVLKRRYPALPAGQVRPSEPNMNELIYKIGVLERRASNLEDAILEEDEEESQS